jgi:hypothetical protein
MGWESVCLWKLALSIRFFSQTTYNMSALEMYFKVCQIGFLLMLPAYENKYNVSNIFCSCLSRFAILPSFPFCLSDAKKFGLRKLKFHHIQCHFSPFFLFFVLFLWLILIPITPKPPSSKAI